MKTQLNFKSAKEFVNFLMDNEGKVVSDGYGRQWLYEDFSFSFKDIGTYDIFRDGLNCLHLYGTNLFYTK